MHYLSLLLLPNMPPWRDSKLIGATIPRTSRGIPVLLYFPEVIVERSVVSGNEKTDAVMLGYVQPGEANIDLSHALLLPASLFNTLVRRVRDEAYVVLETYMRPNKNDGPPSAHQNAYSKLMQACALMTESRNREEDLTKRWRATPGIMTQEERGSVWEGWAVTIDKTIGMDGEERKGAVVTVDLGPEKVGEEAEEERRRREFEAMMEEENEL